MLVEERAEEEEEDEDDDEEPDDGIEEEEGEEEEEEVVVVVVVETPDSEAEEEEDEEPDAISDVDVEVSDTLLVLEELITGGGGAQGSYKCPYCTSELEVESSETLALSSLLESSSDVEELVVELL